MRPGRGTGQHKSVRITRARDAPESEGCCVSSPRMTSTPADVDADWSRLDLAPPVSEAPTGLTLCWALGFRQGHVLWPVSQGALWPNRRVWAQVWL